MERRKTMSQNLVPSKQSPIVIRLDDSPTRTYHLPKPQPTQDKQTMKKLIILDDDPEPITRAPSHPKPQSSINNPQSDLELLHSLFPTCQKAHLKQLYEQTQNLPDRLQQITNHLLENPYPIEETKPVQKTPPKSEPPDFFNTSKPVSEIHEECTRVYLCNEFPRVSMPFIRNIIRQSNGHLVPAYSSLKQLLEKSPGSVQLLKNQRAYSRFPGNVPEIFLDELEFVKKKIQTEIENKDHELALQMNRDQYEKSGDLIECGCCFDEFSFDEMTCCLDGHVFCRTCASRAVKAVLENGKTDLHCLQAGCLFGFSLSEMEKFLSPTDFAFYQRSVQQEELRKAASELNGLQNCPFCDFALIIEDENTRVFKCENPSCLKESCISCKKESHIPLKCEEVKTEKISNMQAYITNLMSEALVRQCPKCSARFLKEEGCNKMTCRCGQSMCYICKVAIPSDYSHFNTPGSKCVLFSDNAHIHAKELREAQLAAHKKFLSENPDLKDVELNSVVPEVKLPEPAAFPPAPLEPNLVLFPPPVNLAAQIPPRLPPGYPPRGMNPNPNYQLNRPKQPPAHQLHPYLPRPPRR